MRQAPRVPTDVWLVLRHTSTREVLRFLRGKGWYVKKLGSGCFRTAYLIRLDDRELVIKKYTRRHAEYLTRSSRIKFAPFTRVGVWEVQHYYSKCMRALDKWMMPLRGDIKSENCGFDTDGTIVAFDY